MLEGGDDIQLEPGDAVTLVQVEPGRAHCMYSQPMLTQLRVLSTFLRKNDSTNAMSMEGVASS